MPTYRSVKLNQCSDFISQPGKLLFLFWDDHLGHLLFLIRNNNHNDDNNNKTEIS